MRELDAFAGSIMLSLARRVAAWLPGLLALSLALLLPMLAVAPAAIAGLPPGNAITDGRALLRYSLPIDSPDIREIQKDIEGLSDNLRAKRWAPIERNLKHVSKVLNLRPKNILAAVPEERRSQAEELLAELKTDLSKLEEATAAKNKPDVQAARNHFLAVVGEIEELMVERFPFEVPEEYRNLPRLEGRATIAVETTQGDLTLVVDGYSAPITAGNFVDLVQRGFYNGLPFTRAEDFYVLQIGDPVGPETGFIDPKTKQERQIPLEILVEGDREPVYGSTLEELGRYTDNPVLPFSAFGTLGWARPSDNLNGGSSQFFFFLFEPELTPAGLNLIDGRYAAFGYLVDGKDVLEKLRPEDKILKATVVSGAENLIQPS
ncbi:peptidyl-prolyl cis-trans isomerase [Synechococcus elongatus PCC 6301]|uniref:peptidylprolyl isomerase n=3 Tax=Synechococcus elongatus TaxID=32046 RepID=Q54759_SYNE7|nr:unknown [Synechococcus elongatus PCC 7942 = FACHB-805]BAD79734.1 peptidyl-prolyl cis-trans isomerase [Synechococcus elongatus PCC 6301]